MKAWALEGGFGFENLKLAARPLPEPGSGEVRVRLRAASLNYRDLLMVRGHYNPRQPLPLILGSDAVGEVECVGAGANRFAVGDRVAGIFAQKWLDGEPTMSGLASTLGGPLDGILAEQVVLHEDGLVGIPPYLTDAEAATLPCAGVTAWSALLQAGTRAEWTVLVQGTGGVSTFAFQLATLLGARVIVTSSSDVKLERAHALGAWKTINYRSQPKWGRIAKQLTGGVGVDQVIEVGGVGTLQESLKAVRPAGHVSLIGILAGKSGPVDLTPALMQNIRIQGVIVGPRTVFESLLGAIARAELRPVVDRIFPFEEVKEAFAHMESGQHFGKVCLEMAR